MEFWAFLAIGLGAIVFLLWRTHRHDTDDVDPIAFVEADLPDRETESLETARVHIGTAPGPGGTITGIGNLGGSSGGGSGGGPGIPY